MTGRVAGKIAFVTGAASPIGIGYGIAAMLAREGATVVLTDVAQDGVTERAAELRALGLDALSFGHDVTDESRWREVVEEVARQRGPLDILVNNAGIAILLPVEQLAAHDFRRLVEVNLTGAFLGCKIALEQMRAHRRSGSIINISSVSGLVGIAGTAGYGATKGGMRIMTKGIAIEAARDGIRCNSVHPGAIWTEIQHAAIAKSPETFGQIEKIVPMGRIGDPADVAAAVLYLASDESKYVTGVELAVDGGLTAG